MNLSAIHVNIIGYFTGFTGFNIHTQEWANALSCYVICHCVDITGLSIAQIKINIDNLKDTDNNTQVIDIHINHPDLSYLGENRKSIKINFFIWEGTLVPKRFIDALKDFDFVFAPTDWGKNVLIQNNAFNPEQIFVVPEGINPAIYNNKALSLPQLDAIDGFKWIHIGKWEERKNTPMLISTFEKIFLQNKKNYLILMAHNPFLNLDYQSMIQQLAPKSFKQILCIDPVGPSSVVASIIRSADAGVFPARAEGWGLPLTEVLACGKPIVATNYSGPTAYLQDEIAIKIDCGLIDSKNPEMGLWGNPLAKDLENAMLTLMQNPLDLVKKGEQAMGYMHQFWTWEQAAQKTVQIFLDF
jgi:glycosyltransferase involved in cell wall biosynthesis